MTFLVQTCLNTFSVLLLSGKVFWWVFEVIAAVAYGVWVGRNNFCCQKHLPKCQSNVELIAANNNRLVRILRLRHHFEHNFPVQIEIHTSLFRLQVKTLEFKWPKILTRFFVTVLSMSNSWSVICRLYLSEICSWTLIFRI